MKISALIPQVDLGYRSKIRLSEHPDIMILAGRLDEALSRINELEEGYDALSTQISQMDHRVEKLEDGTL